MVCRSPSIYGIGSWSCATVEELVAAYWSPTRHVVDNNGLDEGTKVVKISEHAVIKCRLYVAAYPGNGIPMDNCKAAALQSEAINQRMARQLIDPDIVRIPKVYRSFLHQDYSYIVMEYIKGRSPKSDDFPEIMPKLSRLMAHMASITGYDCGPLGGGYSHGILWENEDFEFRDLHDMEDFWNSRLLPAKNNAARISFKGLKLVLCHLDIAPRNILLLDDNSICLLDWESAGFYPRFFEFCAQSFLGHHDIDFSRRFEESMEQLSKAEIEQWKSVCIACGNTIRYHFPPWPPVPPPPPFLASGNSCRDDRNSDEFMDIVPQHSAEVLEIVPSAVEYPCIPAPVPEPPKVDYSALWGLDMSDVDHA